MSDRFSYERLAEQAGAAEASLLMDSLIEAPNQAERLTLVCECLHELAQAPMALKMLDGFAGVLLSTLESSLPVVR